MVEKVIRSYILPKRGPKYVEKISAEEGEHLLKKFIGILDFIIRHYLSVKGKSRIESASELYNLLNNIVTVIKWNLYYDSIPDILPTPAFLITYLIRHPQLDPCSFSTLSALHDEVVLNLVLNESTEYSNFRNDMLEILRYPADTRPAANSSSLILHMLTTSAIASSIFINSNNVKSAEGQYELTMLRLLSLFHDIGKFKMKMWREHEEISANILMEIFSKYVDGDAKKIVDKVADTLKSAGKSDSKILRIFRRADRIASGIDRISDYFLEALSPNIKSELLKYVKQYKDQYGSKDFKSIYNDWRFWNLVGPDDISKFSENFAVNVSKISSENPLLKLSRRETLDKNILIARFDIRKIQRYIRVNDLKSMCGGSRIIDYLCFVALPAMLINKLDLPAECILYFGGGNVTAIIPNSRMLEEFDSKCVRLEEEFDVSIIHGESKLYGLLSMINYEIDMNLSREKASSINCGSIEPNISYICDFCYRTPAVEKIPVETETHYVCKSCKNKYRIGYAFHFKYRVEQLSKTVNPKLRWDKRFSKRVLEYIAGVNYESLDKIAKYPNIALIRFDANLASQLMASCISISDAVERSVRIDYSVKKAIHSFLNYLKNNYSEDYCRLVLGIMYMGGDDGFIIAPSYLAIPLALHLAREFYLEMGCKATLSIGIAVAKPKHPLIQLYEASGHLLNNYSKTSSRNDVLTIHKNTGTLSWNFCGSLSFYVADGGVMSSLALDSITENLTVKGLSLMGKLKDGGTSAYSIADKSKSNSIFKLLNLIFEGCNVDKFNFNDMVDKLVTSVNEIRNNREDELHEEMHKLRNYAMKLMTCSLFSDDTISIKIIYTARQIGRKIEGSKYYQEIIKNLLDPTEMVFPLHDLIYLIKILDGGFKF